MLFIDRIEHAKQARAMQPYLPPALWCIDAAGTDRAAVLAAKANENSIAGMLAMIPVSKAHEAVVGLECYVRPEDAPTDTPIGEDPLAKPAVVLLRVTRDGEVETSINPYSIDDAGELTWATPGPLASPAIPKLLDAIKAIFQITVAGDNAMTELIEWLAFNNYAVKIAKDVIQGGDNATE